MQVRDEPVIGIVRIVIEQVLENRNMVKERREQNGSAKVNGAKVVLRNENAYKGRA